MAENLHTKEDLRQRQALPLEAKISMTQLRIRQWYNYWCGDVCVSFSGGKDSTVLLHLVRQMYPDVKAIFVNTGLEYPEIQQFVRTFDNVNIVRPEMRFDEVISKYGYPLISKEVAEAIYYARRIRSQTVQVERERERRRNDLHGRWQTGDICHRAMLNGCLPTNGKSFVETERSQTQRNSGGGVRRPWLRGTATNREQGIGTASTDSKPG